MIVVVLVWPKKAVIVQKAVPDIVNLEFEAAKNYLRVKVCSGYNR